MIKELMPEASIGVDVIVGFPGEDDDKFLRKHEFYRGTRCVLPTCIYLF